MIHTNYVPVGEVITEAAQELRDEDFGLVGRPFYLAAAQRGMSKMMKEVFGDERYWSTTIPANGIVQLPDGMSGVKGAWLYNGNTCDVSKSTPLFIKPNMHRLGGEGYLANNTWNNHDDPFQFSFGATRDPHGVYAAGFSPQDKQLHLLPACRAFQRLQIVYYGIGIEPCEDGDFYVPEWAQEAIVDFVVHRIATRQRMNDVIARKQEELKGVRGNWMQAKVIFKRMDPKTRYDTMAMIHRYGHIA
jgi:hypothetical protein